MAALVRLQSKHSVGTEKDNIAISLPTAESHRKRPPKKRLTASETLRLNQSYRVSRCTNAYPLFFATFDLAATVKFLKNGDLGIGVGRLRLTPLRLLRSRNHALDNSLC